MVELGFWNFAQRAPEKLALADPSGREWSRGELLASVNKIAHGPISELRQQAAQPDGIHFIEVIRRVFRLDS